MRRDREIEMPMRRCIATGASRPAAEMVRFVIGPGGAVVPDIRGRLPGRGIWVSADHDALSKAARRNLFSKAARVRVTVPDGLPASVDAQLAGRIVELLSLARRGGGAVCGFERTREALARGDAAVLLQAEDGSERQKSRLRPPPGEATAITCLRAREMGLAFGRERVIHAAVAKGGLSSRMVVEARRLRGVRAVCVDRRSEGHPPDRNEGTG